MTTMYIATGDAVIVVNRTRGGWESTLQLVGRQTQCIAADPLRPDVVYCGTFGQGLWRSEDAGDSWQPAGEGVRYAEVMAVAVSSLERVGRHGVVWVGTEPSDLFRSEDGGDSWVERPSLLEVPSASTWFFPPRPWTHHVRWIAPDPNVAERIFVGIELGGVLRSLDDGLTWEDRKPGSQPDAHTLRTHQRAPGRVYEAAGGGYAESFDGGDTWTGYDAGLQNQYLWGLAVDPENPHIALTSASPGARQAHAPLGRGAQATIYRRNGSEPWREIRDGLPNPVGTPAYVLATNQAEPGTFYAAPHQGGIYRSEDTGLTWEWLDIAWPDGYHAPDVRGLVVVELP
jgi:hypothetical protein